MITRIPKTKEEFVKSLVRSYEVGEENAFEVYGRHFAMFENETDLQFVKRCAIADFHKGEEAIYADFL